jgi:hypothetical protein
MGSNGVGARRKVAGRVLTGAIGLQLDGLVCGLLYDAHGGVRDGRSFCIGHGAGNGPALDLRVAREGQRQQRCEYPCPAQSWVALAANSEDLFSRWFIMVSLKSCRTCGLNSSVGIRSDADTGPLKFGRTIPPAEEEGRYRTVAIHGTRQLSFTDAGLWPVTRS